MKLNEVNRCLARYSQRATTTDQPTNKGGKAWPKVTKYANFWPNLVVFGQKILILMGVSESFSTHLTEEK